MYCHRSGPDEGRDQHKDIGGRIRAEVRPGLFEDDEDELCLN